MSSLLITLLSFFGRGFFFMCVALATEMLSYIYRNDDNLG